jgi:adenine phosphoribosyltransferase
MNEDQRSTDLKRFIRDVPDFPKPGILFKDITPLLGDRRAFTTAIDLLTELHVQDKIDMVLGIESRGFLFGAPLALRLGAGFVPVRKPGKLPADKVREEYALEYGTDAVEMHRDAIVRGARVLVVDDVIATGGTALAAIKLAGKLGAEVVGAAFFVELGFLEGRARLEPTRVTSVLRYG